jgi:hypothetical protein
VVVAVAVRAASLVFTGLLLIAIAHKTRVLAERRESAEPLVASAGWTRNHARGLVACAIAVETVAALLLVVAPLPGFLALAAVTACYAIALRSLPADNGCRCFGSVLEMHSRAGAIRRNVAIATVAVLAAAGYASGELAQTTRWDATVGVALLACAGIAAHETLKWFRGTLSPERGGSGGYQ